MQPFRRSSAITLVAVVLFAFRADGDLPTPLTAGDGFFETQASQVMHAFPRTIAPDALVVAALRHMEDDPPGPVTSLVVIENDKPVGVVHLHDCLKLGVR